MGHVCVADFESKAGTVRELYCIQEGCVRIWFCTGSCSYDILVKKSFPFLKRMANAYQSLREAFYQHAKVPHSVYGSINARELLYTSALVSGYYQLIIGSLC